MKATNENEKVRDVEDEEMFIKEYSLASAIQWYELDLSDRLGRHRKGVAL